MTVAFIVKWPIFTVKYLIICYQVIILFIFYYIGVFIQALVNIPFPASIIGLLLLLVCLRFKIIRLEYINRGAGFLIAYLPLLFVPICIGIMKYPQLFSGKGFKIMFVILISTVLTMLVAGRSSQLIEKSVVKRKEKNKWEKY